MAGVDLGLGGMVFQPDHYWSAPGLGDDQSNTASNDAAPDAGLPGCSKPKWRTGRPAGVFATAPIPVAGALFHIDRFLVQPGMDAVGMVDFAADPGVGFPAFFLDVQPRSMRDHAGAHLTRNFSFRLSVPGRVFCAFCPFAGCAFSIDQNAPAV